MSATIYSAPEEIKLPKFNWKSWVEDEEVYLKELKDWCFKNSNSKKNVGEIINIPHADGYAKYMVFSMKPLSLIHIATGDAWNSQYAELLTPKKVNEMIENEKKLKELFG